VKLNKSSIEPGEEPAAIFPYLGEVLVVFFRSKVLEIIGGSVSGDLWPGSKVLGQKKQSREWSSWKSCLSSFNIKPRTQSHSSQAWLTPFELKYILYVAQTGNPVKVNNIMKVDDFANLLLLHR